MPPVRPRRSPLAVATGERLRRLRDARDLSVSALALRSGLGKGTLSELETGRRNPTLETLYAVTTALDVPLSAALPPGEATARVGAAPIRGDAIDAVLVDRFIDVITVSELYRITLRADRSQDSAPHAPGVTEHWILYSGAIELGPQDALMRLASGESCTFAADVPHRYRVLGDADATATLLVRYPH